MKPRNYLYILTILTVIAPKIWAQTTSIITGVESTKSKQSLRVVLRGERPPIDYASVPDDAFHPGVFRVKFSESVAAHLDETSFSTDKSGSVQTGLEDFDLLSSIYHLSAGRALMNTGNGLQQKSSDNAFSDRHREWGFHLWYEFQTPNKTDLIELIHDFSNLSCVEVVEPIFRVEQVGAEAMMALENDVVATSYKSQPLSNDPRYGHQWSFQNTGQTGGNPGSDIGLAHAWNIERGNQKVIVAIIDGGVQTDHPDLSAHIWKDAEGYSGYNFTDNTTTIVPGNHATHIAGIIAAVSNNAIGVSGIAGGSGNDDGVRLMICQVFGEEGSGGFHLAPVYAADNGAAITQNSWVYGAPGVYDQLALDAIDYFNTYGGGDVLKGGISIFAAGNKNTDQPYYPAAYSGTIAVASTNHRDQKAATSNYGSWIDISAPGVSILSTLTKDAYGLSSGTSMACPHVAATAALMLSHAPGLLSANEIIDMMLSTADPLGDQNPDHLQLLGSGRLNAYAALKALPNVNEPEEENQEQPEDEQAEEDEEDAEVPVQDDEQEISEPVNYYYLTGGSWDQKENWYLDAEGSKAAGNLPAPYDHIHVHTRLSVTETVVLEKSGKIFIYDGAELKMNDLIIHAPEAKEHQVEVQPGGRLSLMGELCSDNPSYSIRILGDDRGIGSLIHKKGQIEASVVIDRKDPAESWSLLSVPLSDQLICDEVISGLLYGWNEADQSWTSIGNKTAGNGQESRFVPGLGYLENITARQAAPMKKTFSGTLNGGELQFPLSCKAREDDAFSGFNLLGNPYPSSIDWKATEGWSGRENLQASTQEMGYSFWIWNPETGNYGAYNSESRQDLGTNHVSRYIPPMQAFWVKASNDGAYLSVNDQSRLHSDQQTLKKLTQGGGIRLSVHNQSNPYSDEIAIEFGHQADGGTQKMFSLIHEAPALYLAEDLHPMSIRFVSDQMVPHAMQLGFEAGVTALYTLSATQLDQVPDQVLLYDKQTGQQHDLRKNNTYHFVANPGEDASRFILTFGEDLSTSVINHSEEEPSVFVHSGQMQISNPWGSVSAVQVYNLTGAEVGRYDVAAFSTENFSFNHKQGVYIVRMFSQGREHTAKLAVR